MAGQSSALHLDVENGTPLAVPSQDAGLHRLKMMWFLQGMGLAALMLIGVAATGVWPSAWEASLPADTESSYGSVNPQATAFAYHLPTLGVRTGGVAQPAVSPLQPQTRRDSPLRMSSGDVASDVQK